MNFWRFEDNVDHLGHMIQGSYDYSLIILSVVIASLACFSALQVADHAHSIFSRKRTFFIFLGGLTMGAGIWAMHFTGMMAYSMSDHQVSYSMSITLISVLPAIIGCTAAIFLLTNKKISLLRHQTSSFFVATCIALMHYTGMEAMQMSAELRYDFPLFILSYAVAHILASIALAVKYIFNYSIFNQMVMKNILSAILMGIAISAMHYTAMAAAEFYHQVSIADIKPSLSEQTLVIAVTVIVISLIFVTLTSTNIYHQFEIVSNRLIESENELSTFTNSSPVMMWVMDEYGNPKHFNPAWLKFTGNTLKEEISHSWTGDEVHPKDKRECFKTYQTHFANHQQFEHEYRLLAKGGHYRWVKEYGIPFFNTDQTFMGFVGHCVDITQVKLAENELKDYRNHLEALVESRTKELQKSRNEAERASQAKSEFLASMSHELKTPMNAILGFSELMKNDKNLTSDQKENLAIVYSSGQHLLDLINRVLDMSKIESGHMHFDQKPLDLLPILSQAIEMFQVSAQEKNLSLTLDAHEQEYIAVIDALRFKQSIINIIGNALKFTEKGGIHIAITQLNQRISLTINDTGPGIAAEDLERIFLPFEQVQSRQSSAGTGLGLSLSKQYIEAMGGTIYLSSEKGSGTTFHISFPEAS